MAEADLAKTSQRVLKAVVVGPSGVGKSALVRAWKECQLPSSPQPTDSAETRATDGNTLHKADLHFHELGDEASESEAAKHLKDADVVVLVYDRHRPMETLGTLESVWLPRVKMHEGSLAGSLLIANKAKVVRDLYTFLAYTSKADAVFEALPFLRKERLLFYGLDDVQKKALKTRGIVHELACAGRCFPVADDQPGHQEGEVGEETVTEAEAGAVATIEEGAVGMTNAWADEMSKALAHQVAEAVRVAVAKAVTKEMAKAASVTVAVTDGEVKAEAEGVGVPVAEAVENAVAEAVAEAVRVVAAKARTVEEALALIKAKIVAKAMAKTVTKAVEEVGEEEEDEEGEDAEKEGEAEAMARQWE